jgi:16S rRNA (cytosine967-C5)-methyltransferase
MSENPRAIAATVIAATLAQGEALGDNLAAQLVDIDPRDRALVQQLCYSTMRNYPLLEGLLRQLLTKPLKRKDSDIQALLLLGAEQLLHMRTPDHAAISATVEATRALHKPWATKLVNGVLRRLLREQEKLREQLTPWQLSSHPEWLYRALQSAWPDQYQQILAADNSQPPMCLRVNLARIERADYLQLLLQETIDAQPCELSTAGVRLTTAMDVAALPGFNEGLVSVQDEAAQLAALLLAPAAGERVLDACSAPGGKTCHLLEMQPALAELVAMDNDAQRLERVRENLQRLELTATLQLGDARRPELGPHDTGFDKILVDAPCSGTGVIRRHPDIKLLRRSADIASFAKQQQEILNGLWPLLRPGGQLLYATCSVLPEENSAVVEHFLAQNADAALLPLNPDWGIACNPGRQVMPNEGGCDGLFYALIGKG